jgi:hypothetical protein
MMISNEVRFVRSFDEHVHPTRYCLGKRTLLDSLSTFETQLNRALEQNALLENELDEKQQVRCCLFTRTSTFDMLIIVFWFFLLTVHLN